MSSVPNNQSPAGAAPPRARRRLRAKLATLGIVVALSGLAGVALATNPGRPGTPVVISRGAATAGGAHGATKMLVTNTSGAPVPQPQGHRHRHRHGHVSTRTSAAAGGHENEAELD